MSGGGTRLMQVWIHNNYFPKKETQNDILGIVFFFSDIEEKLIFLYKKVIIEKKKL